MLKPNPKNKNSSVAPSYTEAYEAITDAYVESTELYNAGIRSEHQKRLVMKYLNAGYERIMSVYMKEIHRANAWRSSSEWTQWIRTSDYKSVLLPDSLSHVSEKDIGNVIRVNAFIGLRLSDICWFRKIVKDCKVLTNQKSNSTIQIMVETMVKNKFRQLHNKPIYLYDIDVSSIFGYNGCPETVTVDARRSNIDDGSSDRLVIDSILYKYLGHMVPLSDILELRINTDETDADKLVLK